MPTAARTSSSTPLTWMRSAAGAASVGWGSGAGAVAGAVRRVPVRRASPLDRVLALPSAAATGRGLATGRGRCALTGGAPLSAGSPMSGVLRRLARSPLARAAPAARASTPDGPGRTRPAGSPSGARRWGRPSGLPPRAEGVRQDPGRGTGQLVDRSGHHVGTGNQRAGVPGEVLEGAARGEARLEVQHLAHAGGVHAPPEREELHLVG